MPKLFQKTSSLHLCKTTPELYCYLFWRLKKYQATLAQDQQSALNPLIFRMQELIANHVSLDESMLSQELLAAQEVLGDKLTQELNATIKISCKTQVTLQKRWENPFYRNFESQLATAFLLHPTTDMMKVIQIMSEKIILVLKKNAQQEEKQIDVFLEKISLVSHEQEAFGKLNRDKVTLEAVLEILQNNKPEEFHHIVLIQYSFARHLYREFNDVGSNHDPILTQGHYQNFLRKVNRTSPSKSELDNPPIEVRKGFIDGYLRSAAYFKDWRMTRGRGSFNEGVNSNKMGLMLQKYNAEDLPQLALPQKWSPDAICQEPAFDSPYVQETIAKDLIYVAGPSGMTTLFLGMCELFALMPTLAMKETYALCTSVFLVSGGLHSWHETLAVAHDLLGYFPEYSLGKYQAIFEHFKEDVAFQKNISHAWDNFYYFCDKQFRYAELHHDLKISYREFFESKLAIAVCKQGSSLNAVHLVSNAIIQLIANNIIEVFYILEKNAAIKKELYHEAYFGSLLTKQEQSLAVMADLLEVLANKNADLTQIIHIHSVFARHIFDELSVHKAKNIAVDHIDNDRGRVVVNNAVKPNNRLGIVRHSFFNKQIGTTARARLCGMDEFGPDIKSAFYLAMAGKQIPFVSGASGHTVKLLSAAKQYIALSIEGLKEYALACFGYLTTGRNHSFHEVMQKACEAGVPYEIANYNASMPQVFKLGDNYRQMSKQFSEFLEDDSTMSRLTI